MFRGIVAGSPVDVRPRFEPALLGGTGGVHLGRADDARPAARRRTSICAGSARSSSAAARSQSPSHASRRRRARHVVETYGLTESCGGVVYDGTPLPGVEVRIAEDQEVQIAGPTCMRGYRGDADATRAAFTA